MPEITLLTKSRLLQAINADPRVTPMGVKVAVAMLDNLNTKTGRCDPSAGNIAKRVARTERTVSTGRQNLIDTGWLKAKPRRRTWAYEFAFERLCGPKESSDHNDHAPKESSDHDACAPKESSDHTGRAPKESAPQESSDKYGKDSNREDSKPGRESDHNESDSHYHQIPNLDQGHARDPEGARSEIEDEIPDDDYFRQLEESEFGELPDDLAFDEPESPA
jgi:hypothetical protein